MGVAPAGVLGGGGSDLTPDASACLSRPQNLPAVKASSFYVPLTAIKRNRLAPLSAEL
jgi:hypothetical protein